MKRTKVLLLQQKKNRIKKILLAKKLKKLKQIEEFNNKSTKKSFDFDMDNAVDKSLLQQERTLLINQNNAVGYDPQNDSPYPNVEPYGNNF